MAQEYPFSPNTRTQTGFTAGELSPAMYGRIDVDKTSLGLRLCSNFFIRTQGGASNRAGWQHLGAAPNSGVNPIKLIAFRFGTTQNYVLEFSDSKMRVWKDKALVLTGATMVTELTQFLDPRVWFTIVGHDLVEGDEVYVTGGSGKTEQQFADRIMIVKEVSGDTFRLGYVYPVNIAGHADMASDSPLTLQRVYTLETPYTYSDLSTLKTSQSADTLNITTQNHRPYTLTRTAHDNWVLTAKSFSPQINPPTQLSGYCYNFGTRNNTTASYKVTAVDSRTTEESAPAYCTFPSSSDVGTPSLNDDDDGAPPNPVVENRLTFKRQYPCTRYNVYRSIAGSAYTFVGCASNDDLEAVDSSVWHIESVTRTVDDYILVNTGTAHGRSNGDTISIAGVQGEIGALLNNNAYKVSDKTTTTITLKSYTLGDYVEFPAGYDDVGYATLDSTVFTLTTWTAANPSVITMTGSTASLTVGDAVYISGCTGADAATVNNLWWYVNTVAGASTFTLKDGGGVPLDLTGKVVAGGTMQPASYTAADPSVLMLSSSYDTDLMFVGQRLYISGASGANAADVNGKWWFVHSIVSSKKFTIRDESNVPLNLTSKLVFGGKINFGWVNDPTGNQTYVDRLPMTSVATSIQDPPPPTAALNPFQGSSNYPECSAYHEQRLWFGNTQNKPQNLWSSQIAIYNNFNRKVPPAATDSVVMELPSTRVNPVYHMVSQRDLIIFTGDGEWVVSSEQGAISAATARSQQQSYIGADRWVQPVPVSNRVLYVEDRGKGVRDIGYADKSRGYQSDDRTIYSRHLFDGHQVTSMAYVSLPYSQVWCTRDDGAVLALSYEPEQEVFAWSRHGMGGVADVDDVNPIYAFKQVVSIPEGDVDTLYAVVLAGENYYWVVALGDRSNDDGSVAFLDNYMAGVGAYSGAIGGFEHLLTFSNYFTAVIEGVVYPSSTVNSENRLVLPSGSFSSVQVGLPYHSVLETLDLEFGQDTVNKTTSMAKVTAKVEDTRGARFGSDRDYVVPHTDSETGLYTGEVEIHSRGTWESGSRAVVVQEQPFPATVLSVTVNIGVSGY